MRINMTITEDEADVILELMRQSGIADYIRRVRAGDRDMCDASPVDEGVYSLSIAGFNLGRARQYKSSGLWSVRLLKSAKQITAKDMETLRRKVYRFVIIDSYGYADVKERVLSTANPTANQVLNQSKDDWSELL